MGYDFSELQAVNADRLGKALSKEKLDELDEMLDEMELPMVPYDPSIGEMQTLLVYHGNMLAYLLANAELISDKIRLKKDECENISNEVYKEVQNRNEKLSVTTIKNIVSQSERVKTATQELLRLQSTLASVQSKISALQEQNICLRKVVSIQSLAIQKGLE